MQNGFNFSEFPKPAASHQALKLVAGLLWAAVGIMLGLRALSWLVNASQRASVLTITLVFCGLLGLAAGAFIYRGFSRIAARNLGRIRSLGERPCLFAFQSSKSYVLIAVMMTLGFLIRRTSIPKHWLAVLYLGLAVGLAGSSLLYFDTVLSGATARNEAN